MPWMMRNQSFISGFPASRIKKVPTPIRDLPASVINQPGPEECRGVIDDQANLFTPKQSYVRPLYSPIDIHDRSEPRTNAYSHESQDVWFGQWSPGMVCL